MRHSTPTQPVPLPASGEHDYLRFHHRDLADCTPLQLFSERVLLTSELARRICTGQRDRLVWHDGQHGVTDQGWIIDRLARLEAEERRRGQSRARAA